MLINLKTVEEQEMIDSLVSQHEAYQIKLDEIEDKIEAKSLQNDLKKIERSSILQARLG